MQLKLLTHPHPNLRKKSLAVESEEILSYNFQELINELGKTMLKENGIGLAAPQVNMQKRVLVVNLNSQAKEFINPKILRKGLRKNILEEGCLSIPNVFGKVKRPKKIKIRYQDRQANLQKMKCDEYLSRVLQHEIDHLEGVLFIDKIIK